MNLPAHQTSSAAPAGLLVTKLRPPRPRLAAPSRHRLLEAMRAEAAPLILVTAGAGFGKSTLLAHWVASLDHHVAWVSLDAGDNDAVRFWSHVLGSLHAALPRFAEHGVALLRSPSPPQLEALLTELVNELAQAGSIALVLDDYHHLDDPGIHGGVTFLLSNLPENVVVGIGSRATPPLPLARMRGRGEVIEIDADALRATFEEADAFLRSGMDLAIGTDAVRSVLAKTEGWFAGLQLAALALRGREAGPDTIEAFSGEHRLVLTYLTEEVLNGQDPSVQRFLLESSLLSRMNAALCDDVLERSDSARMLEHVTRANLFVDALDDADAWWRFHALFAELLQARLLHTEPERARALHARAARAFAQMGDVGEAVGHHLAAGDVRAAGALVASSTADLLDAGGAATLHRWLRAIPRDAYAQQPELYVALGWATAYAGDPPSVPALLAQAEAAAAARTTARDLAGEIARDLAGEIAALRTHVASMAGRTDEAIALAAEALEHLGEERHWLRGNALLGLGLAHQRAASLLEAEAAATAGARAFEAAGRRHGWLYATYQVGEAQRFQGSLSAAERTYASLLHDGPPRRTEREPAIGHAYAGLCKVALERFDLDEALAHGERGRTVSSAVELHPRVDALLTLTSVQLARGDLAAADAAGQLVIDEARASTRFAWIEARVATLRAGQAIERGRLGETQRWRASLGKGWDAPLGDASWRPGYAERHPELIALLRLSLAERDLAAVERRLAACLASAMGAGLAGHVLELRAVEAALHARSGRHDDARAVLSSALAAAAPEGYVRPFLAGGDDVLDGIAELADAGHAHARHVARQWARARSTTTGAAAAPAGAAGRRADASSRSAAPSHEPLTTRERTVVRLLTTGATNKAIARELDVSVNTVKTHVRTAYGKLGVSSRAELAAVVKATGTLDRGDERKG